MSPDHPTLDSSPDRAADPTASAPSPRRAAVIPAYQAAPWIGQVVRDTLDVMQRVLVVDDGSTDGTGVAAQEAGAEVLRIGNNRGKGHALRRAFDFLFTEVDEIVTLDADGQHVPAEIPKLLAARERTGAGLVLGTRDHLFAEMTPLRRFANTLSSRLISTAAGRTMLDIQTGFRLYARELIAVTGFPEHRFEAESAVVVRTLRRGLDLATVPVRLAVVDGRATSHFRPLVDSLRIAHAVIGARFERSEG
ncbi:MAG: glycosyltransferase family 2 protein [Acidobacteriota bacterium]